MVSESVCHQRIRSRDVACERDMKPAAVIFVFIISIASVYSRGVDEDLLHGRARRDVRSRNNGAAACLPKVTVAAQTCGKELDEKVKARENEDGQDIKCCIYAEFRRCVTTFAEKYCDKDVASVVETVIKGIMNTLNNQCSKYKLCCNRPPVPRQTTSS